MEILDYTYLPETLLIILAVGLVAVLSIPWPRTTLFKRTAPCPECGKVAKRDNLSLVMETPRYRCQACGCEHYPD